MLSTPCGVAKMSHVGGKVCECVDQPQYLLQMSGPGVTPVLTQPSPLSAHGETMFFGEANVPPQAICPATPSTQIKKVTQGVWVSQD